MRIESLTFFRFVAAFIVVIFHYGQRTDIARLFSPFIMSGPQMVSFFFCLSGFVLMISHYEKRKEALRSYYVSRVARIVPVYMLGLLIMVYFRYGSENNGLLSLFLSGAFLQSWFPPYALTFNGPGWSLSVEAFFYATFPLIVFILRSSAIHPVKFSAISLLIYCFTQLLLSNLLSDRFDNAFGSALFDLIYTQAIRDFGFQSPTI